VDPQDRTASSYLTLETGGRYRFGEVRLEQDVIDDALLQRFVRFAPGKPFSNDSIRSTQYALEDSNYFSNVTITSGERDPETLLVPVTIRAEPIRRHRYSVSFGYGTDTELRGRFAWDNRRINTLGHRSRVELTASAVLQEALARYIIPIGDPALEKLEFVGGYINEQLGDVDSERWEATAGLNQAFGKWQRVLFLKLNDERSSFPDGSETQSLLLIPGFSYSTQPPNFLTGWVRDAAYYGEISGSPSTLGSDASYLRFYARAERVWPITEPWYVRLRGELGTSWVDDFSELPASQRFFTGGDRSVRGFALDELSPPGCRSGVSWNRLNQPRSRQARRAARSEASCRSYSRRPDASAVFIGGTCHAACHAAPAAATAAGAGGCRPARPPPPIASTCGP
jgi:translocation and assembly module TamA